MTQDVRRTWERLERVLEVLLPLPASKREARLLELLPDDEALRDEARTLVRASEEAASALPAPSAGTVQGWFTAAHGEAEPVAGRRVGPFELVRLIARGGMGVVYEAKQVDPERTVALKMLRRGPGGEDAVRRFRREGLVLARLQHPGIATLYDVGAHETADGDAVPYLVMELVEGARPLTVHAAEAHLDREARLGLLLQAADAVAAGHRRGVIHRDLKPDNVLVDAHGRVKLVDFGIARMTDGGARTTLTRPGALVGTLGYVAPEQLLEGGAADDVRVDVYALGVIAYELLTGRPPVDLGGLDVLRSMRAVMETPATPASRHVPGLPADLVLVLAKALEKDPEGRYPTVDAFADDVRAFLDARPVNARAPSWHHLLRLFVRRHRVPVLAATLLLLGLAAATWWSVAAGRRAREEEARARGLLAASQRMVRDLLAEPYGALAGVEGTLPARLALVERIEEGARELRADAGDDPDLLRALAQLNLRLARLDFDLGASHLGRPDAAAAAYGEAFDLLSRLDARGEASAPQHRDDRLAAASAASGLGEIAQHRGDLDAALARYEEAQRILDALRRRWPSDPVIRDNALNLVLRRARLLDAREEKERAITLLSAALDEAPSEFEDADPGLLRARGHIADLLGELELLEGRPDRAKAPLATARATFQAYARVTKDQGEALRKLALVQTHLGDLSMQQDRAAEALEHYRSALEHDQHAAAAEPEDRLARQAVQVDHAKLAEVLEAAGRVKEAVAEQRQAARLAEQAAKEQSEYLDPNLDLRITWHRLAGLLARAGEEAEAIDVYEREHDLARRLHEALPDHPAVGLAWAEALDGLGQARWMAAGQEDTPEGTALLQEAAEHFGASRDAYEALAAADRLPAWAADAPDRLAAKVAACEERLAAAREEAEQTPRRTAKGR